MPMQRLSVRNTEWTKFDGGSDGLVTLHNRSAGRVLVHLGPDAPEEADPAYFPLDGAMLSLTVHTGDAVWLRTESVNACSVTVLAAAKSGAGGAGSPMGFGGLVITKAS